MAARRREVAAPAAQAAGVELAHRLLALPELAAPARVAIYASVGDELPTRLLFDALRAGGRTPLFPRCARRILEFAAAERFEDLASGRYGVPEPTGPAVALGPTDAVVVPGLAFDHEGRRLGRGGGYYDRTFPPGAEAPFLVGVGFDLQRVEAVPADDRDRRMDAVVTEREAIRVARGQGSAAGRVRKAP